MADDIELLRLKAKAKLKLMQMQGDEPTFKDVRNPDVGIVDRTKVKALSSSPQAGISYLKQKYPGLEFAAKDGEIFAKRPEEKEFTAIDPSSLELEDITDLSYDIPAGLVQGAATTAAGLTGGPLGVAAASAASSAGTEALRQLLGKYVGMENNISPAQIGIAGGIGSVAPGVGTGLSKVAGLVGSGAKAVGSKVSDVSRSVARKAARFSPDMEESFLRNREGVNKWLGLIQDTKSADIAQDEAIAIINRNLKTLKEKGLQQYDEEVINAVTGKPVNISSADIDKLKEMGAEEAANILNSSRLLLTSVPSEMPLKGEQVQSLKKFAQKIAEYKNLSTPEVMAGVKAQAKQEEAGSLAAMLRQKLEDAVPSVAKTNQELQQGLILQADLERGLKAPISFLKSATDDNLARMARVSKRTGDDDLFKQNVALRTAKAISPVDIDDAILRQAERFAGRKALSGIDTVRKAGASVAPYLDLEKALESPYAMPTQMWNEILKQRINKDEK